MTEAFVKMNIKFDSYQNKVAPKAYNKVFRILNEFFVWKDKLHNSLKNIISLVVNDEYYSIGWNNNVESAGDSVLSPSSSNCIMGKAGDGGGPG